MDSFIGQCDDSNFNRHLEYLLTLSCCVLWLPLVGFSVIIPKLNDLLPILLNCFQELISAVQNVPSLDAQSFDCMLSILHSIDLSVSFFVYVNDEGRLEIPPSEEGFFDATMRPETISTILLKKFLVLFPLNPDHQFSEKVYLNTVVYFRH